MLTVDEKNNFNEIFEVLGETLDITETQYNTAVSSYGAVGNWLAKPESPLAQYKPIIRPQGSFTLGTMIKPVCDEDDLDIDLVCELTGKKLHWTQYDLKQAVGNHLKDNETYNKMPVKESRRCWTLTYSESANYHMDILPCIVSEGYNALLGKTFSSPAIEKDYNTLAIRITDNKSANYKTDTVVENWMKSNPFGYAKWFFNKATFTHEKRLLFADSVNPVPKFQKEKFPLQRAIQLLKRHRDIMFNGNDDKPISIIITTLATLAYNKDISLIEALFNLVNNMDKFIDIRYDYRVHRDVKWISNPVNPEENFADKWIEHPQREANFFKWLSQIRTDINIIAQQRGRHNIATAMKKAFGELAVTKVFSTLGERDYNLSQSGNMKMSTGTGILGSTGTVKVQSHNFHGNDKKK